jgi:hypothetical protein
MVSWLQKQIRDVRHLAVDGGTSDRWRQANRHGFALASPLLACQNGFSLEISPCLAITADTCLAK